ncbi:hypothetical protein SAMN04488005_0995 [Yoonia tamlensis]|uniref:Uncharacterized protein n=1 Tax=Yoonia tamlensis TaxID=390270 RepID=A0A1I6G351_9RHOB|nr:hypothetical protein [Yoonia tamlensis]SFR36602.1 hypothetical protein SAMN04488005_0995 [Yoonia tamlensis]
MTADELLIHIGHRYTDAVLLQDTLIASRKVLSDSDIYFPKFASENREKFMLGYETKMVAPSDTSAPQSLPKPDHWDRIASRLNALPCQTVVVSNRHYFKQLTPQTVAHFDAMTSFIAGNKKIVAYLRAPDAYFVQLLQHRLSHNRDMIAPSRTRIKERIAPLSQGWSGAISLAVFSETVLTQNSIVDDFFAHHLPRFDKQRLLRPRSSARHPLSAEAIALLVDRQHGRLDDTIDPDVLVRQIIHLDARLAGATPVVLHPHAARSLRNWAAPDLAWLHQQYGIVFPEHGYLDVDGDDVDLSVIHFTDAAQICAYDRDRKDALYEKARARARMPRLAQRLLTIW